MDRKKFQTILISSLGVCGDAYFFAKRRTNGRKGKNIVITNHKTATSRNVVQYFSGGYLLAWIGATK